MKNYKECTKGMFTSIDIIGILGSRALYK